MMPSIYRDSDPNGRAVSPVLGCLEPVWKTAAPFQHAGWRWLQCTKTPNEYKVLIPPKPANDYARLLETEQIELAEKNVDWEYIAYLKRLKRRMITRASKLEQYRPPHAQNGGLYEVRAPACFRLKQIEKWARAMETGQRKPTPEKHWHECPVTPEILHPIQHDATHPRSQTTILDQPDLLSPNRVQPDSTYRPLVHRHGSLIPPISNSPETVSLVQDVRPTPPNGGESLFELYRNPSSNGDSPYQPYKIPRSELSPNSEAHPITMAIFVDKQVQTDKEHANTTIAMSSEPSVRTRSAHRRSSSSEKPSIRAPRLSTKGTPSSAVIDGDSLQLTGTHTDSSIADYSPNLEDKVLEIGSKPLGNLLHGVTSSLLGKFPIPPSSPTSSDPDVVQRPLSDPLPRKSRWKHHTNRSHRSPAKSNPSGSPRVDNQAQGDNKNVPKRLTTNPRPSDVSQSSEGQGMETDRSGTRKMENPFISGNTHRVLTPPRKKSNLTTKYFHTSVEESNKESLQEDVRDRRSHRSFVPDPVAPSHHAAPPNNPALVEDTHSSESHASQQPKPKHRVPPSSPRRDLHSTSVYPRTQNLPSQTFKQSPLFDQLRSVPSDGVPTGRSDAAHHVNADHASIFSRAQIDSFNSFELPPLDAIRISIGSNISSKPSMPLTPTKSDDRQPLDAIRISIGSNITSKPSMPPTPTKSGDLQPLDAIRISIGSKETSKPSMPPTPAKSDDRKKHASHSSMDPTPKFARSQTPSFQSLTLDPSNNVVRTSSHSVAPRSPNIVPTTMEAREPSELHLPSSPGTLNHGRRSASSSKKVPAMSPTRSPISPPSPVAAPSSDNLLHRVPTLLRSSTSPKGSPISPPSPVVARPPYNSLHRVSTLLRSSTPLQCHPLSPTSMTIAETTNRPSTKPSSRKTTLLSILRKAFRRLKRRRSVRWVAGLKDGIIGSDFGSRPHSLSRKSSSERDFNSTSARRSPLTRIVMEEGGVTFSLVFPPNFKATRTPHFDALLPQ